MTSKQINPETIMRLIEHTLRLHCENKIDQDKSDKIIRELMDLWETSGGKQHELK